MPRTRSLAWSELKIGIVSIVALVLASVLIFLLSGEGGFFWQRYSLKTVFDNIAGPQGRRAGARRRRRGRLGQRRRTSSATRSKSSMEIAEEHQAADHDRVAGDAGSVSLLGEGAVDITPSSRGTPIPEWGYVPTGAAPPTIAEVGAQATAGHRGGDAAAAGTSAAGRAPSASCSPTMRSTAISTRWCSPRIASPTQIASGRGTLGRLTNDPRSTTSCRASVARSQRHHRAHPQRRGQPRASS